MADDRIILGLWPIAGITTVGVTQQDAESTIVAAIEGGIRTFDTAFSYGFDGESDRLLGRSIRPDRESFRVFGKVGQRWTQSRKRIVDGSPKQLRSDAETSLQRLGCEYFDTLFFHQPDPEVDLEESASAFARMREDGLCRTIGICNATHAQVDAFARVVPIDALQSPLNYVQRFDQAGEILHHASGGKNVYVFWTLMKGLLAGAIGREHSFAAGDSRPGYAVFQEPLRSLVHDTLDELKAVADAVDQTLAQLAVSWAISQQGVSGALVGARRPAQIREIVGSRMLDQETLRAIEEATARFRT
ncbi:MAG: aldo/keto reductase [Planctomycetota bacterium]